MLKYKKNANPNRGRPKVLKPEDRSSINVYMDTELKNKCLEYCKQHNTNLSDFIRGLINEFLCNKQTPQTRSS